MSKQYPYTGWILMPSYKPKEETFVKGTPISWHGAYDTTDSDKNYCLDAIYPSKEAAIAAGHLKLDEQRAKLIKAQERIDKRRAALTKAPLDKAAGT